MPAARQRDGTATDCHELTVGCERRRCGDRSEPSERQGDKRYAKAPFNALAHTRSPDELMKIITCAADRSAEIKELRRRDDIFFSTDGATNGVQQDARGATAKRNIADHDLFIQAVGGEDIDSDDPAVPQHDAG